MKKLLFTVFLVSMLSVAASAQTRLGGFIGYGSDIKQVALGFVAEFMLSNQIGLAPDLTFYIPEKDNNIKHSWYELNGDLHYYPGCSSLKNFYLLTGINYTHGKAKNTNNDDVYYDNGEAGLNVGMGVNFDLDKVLPFIQMKYVVSDYDHAFIGFGVKVKI